MKYIELTVHTTSEASELVADAMWEVSPYGVTVCDARDIIALQKDSAVFWDYIDEGVSRETDVLVKCYFDPETAAGQIAALTEEIRARRDRGCVSFGTLEDTKREIEGDDWIEVWKKHFRPIPIGRITIVPEWIEYRPAEGERIVLLDSNMAFGTGEHETTSMCLTLLQKYLEEGDAVLDVGCGSGILGISAVKLGAGRAYLNDLDPIAVASSLHNAQKNGAAESVFVREGQIEPVTADLALANITAEVLVLLKEEIASRLKEGGTLILSGIIADRLAFVEEAYASVGFCKLERMQKGEWYALVLKKEA